jgi:hypothetical protein
LQAVETVKIYGHDNAFTIGGSLDYGRTRFTGYSQLGMPLRADNFNATDRLTLTGGRRFILGGISLQGANGALLNGYPPAAPNLTNASSLGPKPFAVYAGLR